MNGDLDLVLGSDGTKSWKAPGGGSQPVQGNYSGDPVTIADGAAASLPFTNLDSGTELLDRTTPTAPTLLAAGTYVLTLKVFGDALTAAGWCFVRGSLALNFGTTTEHPDYGEGVTIVRVCDAGDLVGARVENHDGVAARDFYIDTALLVKLA